ncbi:hypothetical protein ACFO25_13060 [Paenactinomyces guangxiensis]|uniref:Uncharacterized protein n=1 Tax=Paenactinomyces guangxiensis TaxID=1490290 RepID=A0A7W1WP57_9BACL|nr:hypothetical protein [Paenactinomyces guangxiensis]MBA4493378.1 hypothetical protein [Paenactinomyces guangxiensis]MBH8590468.1 hypothetical protein [Paenactinomyces guangxiensis]
MGMNSWQSFLKGFKPACYENLNFLTSETLAKLHMYPSVDAETGFKVFFQTDDQKKQFLWKIQQNAPGSIRYERVLGEILGFPPKAVEYYTDHLERQEKDPEKETVRFRQEKVGISYCGVSFSSHISTLYENVIWLWERYKQPFQANIKATEYPSDELHMFGVDYLDYEGLQEADQQAKEILNQVRSYYSSALTHT